MMDLLHFQNAGGIAEEESIQSLDVRGDAIRGDTYSQLPGQEDVYPFADYLKKLIKDADIKELVDFEIGDRFVPDPHWGTEPPRLFPGWLEDITGGSDHARWALEYGDVRLSAIPEELMVDSEKDKRIAWLEEQLSDETKELMDQTNAPSARLDLLFGVDKREEYQRELIGVYLELFSAGRGTSTDKSP